MDLESTKLRLKNNWIDLNCGISMTMETGHWFKVKMFGMLKG